jgi:hypothetical protein
LGSEIWAGPGGTEDLECSLVECREAYPGVAVQVRQGHRKARFEGMVGVIEKSFGSPEYPALDVRLEDGRFELFWFHQLDKLDGPSERNAEELLAVSKR